MRTFSSILVPSEAWAVGPEVPGELWSGVDRSDLSLAAPPNLEVGVISYRNVRTLGRKGCKKRENVFLSGGGGHKCVA